MYTAYNNSAAATTGEFRTPQRVKHAIDMHPRFRLFHGEEQQSKRHCLITVRRLDMARQIMDFSYGRPMRLTRRS